MEYGGTGKSKGNKKSEIVRYIFKNDNASKTELTKALGLSMPTILQNTKELIEQGFLVEVGEYKSTGGRRAKSLAVNGRMGYSVGLDVTPTHISYVLLDLAGTVLRHGRTKRAFENSNNYYQALFKDIERFIEASRVDRELILGIGVALPGNINAEDKILIKSHALDLEGINLKTVDGFIPYPVFFENDANAAMIAERESIGADAIYLFLGSTVGSALKADNIVHRGKNRKAGEVGHVILVPGGRPCYCGKNGCVDSYCSVQALEKESGMPLDEFMCLVEKKDPSVMKIWDAYLDYLAITISNLRMIHDTELILGGDMGEYLENYMMELGARIREYNKFDSDSRYLKISRYKKESAAIGVALHFVYECFDNIY